MLSKKEIYRCKDLVTPENLDKSFITDVSTGELYPLYMYVPCGHCDCCHSTKVNSFVERCKLESYSYDSLPIFVTFTYAPEHLPDDGVRVRDVQLFLKRYRSALSRSGYNEHFRYYICAEYGTKTHRPHYHGIFWNLKPTNTHSYLALMSMMHDCWQHGFIWHRCVDMKNDKCFFYTSKYMAKPQVPVDGKNRTFSCSSRRNGGIGATWIDKHADILRRTLNTSYKVKNPFNGKITDFQFNRYALNRIFPSFSRSCPYKFRRSVNRFALIYNMLDAVDAADANLKSRFTAVYEQFKDKLPIYRFVTTYRGWQKVGDKIDPNAVKECPLLNHMYNDELDKSYEVIKDHWDFDFAKAERAHMLRQKFVDKLTALFAPIDLKHKAYLFRQMLNRSISLEVT